MLHWRLSCVALVLCFAIPTTLQNTTSDADAFAHLRTEWANQLHAKQLDRFAALYTPDAVFLPPTGERITGRDAIREMTRGVMAQFTSTITLHSITAERSGDLAYDSGDFTETLVATADGAKMDSRGNYLMILKRSQDGSWSIAQQVWTGSQPPATKR
jgi:uncharacterized protein (TIGR02246 family)